LIFIIVIIPRVEVDDVIRGSPRRAAGSRIPLRRNLMLALRRLGAVRLEVIPVDSVVFGDFVAGVSSGQRHVPSHRRESIGEFEGLHVK
jgi:hypothetical protein